MRFKTLLQAGLALAGLTLVVPQLAGPAFLVSPAAAAIEVEVGTDQFYDELAPYGDWVRYRGGYVFVPADVDERWRPYAVGRWAYTDDYGWMWISDEPFGWATYHYGRWGYAEDLGWYWVPGRVWAPAWVSWRKGPDYVVWAPLPPTFGDDYYDEEGDEDYEIADSDIPDNYWNAVPAASFLAANLAALIYADDDEDYGYHRRRYIDDTEYLGPVRYRNRMVRNNGLDAGFIERESRQKVHRYKVRETDDFRYAGKRNGDEIQIYDRKVKYRPDAKPIRVKNVQEVEQRHGKRWKNKGAGAPQFGSGQQQPENAEKRQQQFNDGIESKNRKKNADQFDGQSTDGKKLTKKQRREAEKQKKKQRNQDFSNENQQGQGTKKKRNQNSSNQDQLGVMDSQGGDVSSQGNQGKKKKRNQGAASENSQSSDGFSNQQGKKKKKRTQDAASENSQNSDGFTSQQGKKKKRNQDAAGENLENSDGFSNQQGKKKKRNQASDFESSSQNESGSKKKRKQSDCDPATGANC